MLVSGEAGWGSPWSCRWLLARWEESEDHHYALRGLRWGAAFFARRDDMAGAHACAEALTRIASDTGHPDALAALAHAIGETALADGDGDTAAEQLGQAVELHPWPGHSLPARGDRAARRRRRRGSGRARACAGAPRRRLSDARKLGARPLAAEAAREVSELGESVVRRLGRRTAADAEGGGLSRRELEVVRLAAVGRTNRGIAQELFLSPRTVDTHARNILRKLDCRSRVRGRPTRHRARGAWLGKSGYGTRVEQSRSQPAGERIALEGEAAVVVRPLEPADADLVQAVFDRMGEDARYLRFLGHKKRLSRRDVEVLTGIDHHGHEALVALDAEGGMAVGVARMIRYPRRPEVAEVAVSVVDDWQGRGLGSALLERLVERAREEGVERFMAVLVARNQAMLHLFERLGAVRILSRQADNIEVEIDLPVAAGAPQDVLRVAASASRGSSATGADQP